MRLRPKEIEIKGTNPFENDQLGRKEFVDNILNLYKRTDDSLVLSLSGRFGIGKTTLLRMLKARAESETFNFVTIYFNAWESDYIEDSFSAIISEINNLIPKTNKFKNKLKKSSIELLQIAIPSIIKAATLNVVDVSKPFGEAISDISSTLAEQELEKHIQIKKNIDSFKKNLQSAINSIIKMKMKVLIIIDELDRCKPTYAIKTLESVKHIFDISNLNFLFALDYIQLSSTIGHVYGVNCDIDGYLRRFFDLQFDIPEPKHSIYSDYLFDLYDLNQVIERRGIKQGRNKYDKQAFIYNVNTFSRIFNASLRDIEKIVSIFVIVLSVTDDDAFIFPSTLSFLIMLKLFDLTTYMEIIEKKITIEDIVNYFLASETGRNYLYSDDPTYGQLLIAEMNIALFNREVDQNPYKYFDFIIKGDSQNLEFKRMIGNVKDISQEFYGRFRHKSIIDYLVKKINFIDQLR